MTHVFFDERCPRCVRLVRGAMRSPSRVELHSIWGRLGRRACELVGREPAGTIVVVGRGQILAEWRAKSALLAMSSRGIAAFLAFLHASWPDKLVTPTKPASRLAHAVELAGSGNIEARGDHDGETGISLEQLVRQTTQGDRPGILFRDFSGRMEWCDGPGSSALAQVLADIPEDDVAPRLYGLPWIIGAMFCRQRAARV